MKITVKFLRDDKTKEFILNNDSTVTHLFDTINMDPDTAVIIRNKSPIPLDTILHDGDELTVLIVTSGG